MMFKMLPCQIMKISFFGFYAAAYPVSIASRFTCRVSQAIEN